MKETKQLATAASSFRDLIGLSVLEWGPGRAVVKIPVNSQVLNYGGMMAGPVIAATIDAAGLMAGCFTEPNEPELKAVTLSMAVSFIKAVREGVIRAEGVKVGGGRSVFFSTVTVCDESGSVVASGQVTMKYV